MTVVSTASKATMIILDSVVVFVVSSFFWFLYFTYRRTIKFKITEVTTRIGDAGGTSGSRASPPPPGPDAPSASKQAGLGENKMWTSSAAEIGRLNRLANLKYKGYPYPVALCILVAAAGTLVCLAKGDLLPCSIEYVLKRCPWAVVASFAGAYVFTSFDLIRRHRRMEMTAGSLHAAWHRMLSAPILAIVLTPALAAAFAIPTAFGISFLPFNELFAALASTVGKRLGVPDSTAEHQPPNLHKLQGVDKVILDRLQAEDITTTQQLANSDTLALFLSTNIEWKTLLDLTDQSLLYCFIEDALSTFRTLGIRGAIELSELGESLLSKNKTVRHNAHQVITAIAGLLSSSEIVVLHLLETIMSDGQVAYIRFLWQDAFTENLKEDLSSFVSPLSFSLTTEDVEHTVSSTDAAALVEHPPAPESEGSRPQAGSNLVDVAGKTTAPVAAAPGSLVQAPAGKPSGNDVSQQGSEPHNG